jgi:hypothetical protein
MPDIVRISRAVFRRSPACSAVHCAYSSRVVRQSPKGGLGIFVAEQHRMYPLSNLDLEPGVPGRVAGGYDVRVVLEKDTEFIEVEATSVMASHI